MNKKQKLFRKKLALLSELSVDNVVNISEQGNYFVKTDRFSKSTEDIEQYYRLGSVRKHNLNKLYTKEIISINKVSNVIMLTKTGKLLITGKSSPSRYRTLLRFSVITVSNYHKFIHYVTNPSKFTELVYLNKKAEWLKDKSYNIFPLIRQFKSINEFKKYLGYSFLTDKRFESLFNRSIEINGKTSFFYSNELIFEIIVSGYLTTESSRKKLVMNILQLIILEEHEVAANATNLRKLIEKNIEDFKRGWLIQDTIKQTLNYGKTTQNNQEDDDDLPF